ncbi:MAG TPA: arsenite methyltransferase [Aggregatilineales bacterium]|nr:arsenite methyltransferase [Aggregatilineales bacterium]
MSQDTIHDAVRNHYGAIARSAGEPQAASCCGPSSTASSCGGDSMTDGECGGARFYDMQLLEGLPVDVKGLSLGCGDPITIASLKPGETVLDLGSGGGIDCFLAVRQVGETGKVIGVDMTPDMLARANANRDKLGVQNVEFRKGQIEALPVEDNSVDVVMSNCVINLSPDKPAVFREAYRVIRPGGRVSISDVVTEGEFSPELRAQTDKWAECVTGAIDVDRYTGLMREAGFVDITVVDKVSDPTIERQPGMPRVFAARITAYKR